MSARSATAGAWSRNCRRRSSRSLRTRSMSASARFGAIAISASRSSAGSRNRVKRRQRDDDGIGADIDVEVRAERAMASETSSAERPPLPSSSRSAVKAARPGRSAGSAAVPPGTSNTAQTTGTLRCEIARTSRPLGRTARWIVGNRKGPLGPGLGSRSGRRDSETPNLGRPGRATSDWHPMEPR